MQEGIKLLCNSCYQKLKTIQYSEGLYVDRCTCDEGDIYNNGYDRGREKGIEEGIEEGIEMIEERYIEEIDELKDRIHELEEITAKYDNLIDEEEYIDRLGTK